jgi:hypothetical protein
MKEKNLRCKFGKIETSNVGNVNHEGTQEDIIRRCQRDGLAKSEAPADTVYGCGDIQDYVRQLCHPLPLPSTDRIDILGANTGVKCFAKISLQRSLIHYF